MLALRVHGVSNTPPEATLETSRDRLVRAAGNDDTGFYRPVGDPTGPVVAEAYSWGR